MQSPKQVKMNNKVLKFFFDIDDTLYDQYEPFRQAFKYTFGNRYKESNVENIFTDSRARSDEVFDMVSRGEIDKEEMYAYRIGKAFEDNGLYLSKPDCLTFQDNYEIYQGKICLSRQMQNLLTFLSNQGMFLGIISNGPEQHQWFKIKTLGLEKWFPRENIFISGKIGYTKPHREIFQYVENATHNQSDECVYIGDAYPIDVVGAKNANWKSIWFNRRHHAQPSNCEYSPDFIVESELELSELLLAIYHITLSFNKK